LFDEAIEELNKRIVLGEEGPDPEVLGRLARNLKRHGSPVGEVMELYLDHGVEILSCLWFSVRQPNPFDYTAGPSASAEYLFHLDGRDVRVVPSVSRACLVRIAVEGEEDTVLNVSQACCEFLLRSVRATEPEPTDKITVPAHSIMIPTVWADSGPGEPGRVTVTYATNQRPPRGSKPKTKTRRETVQQNVSWLRDRERKKWGKKRKGGRRR
jgi:hypothetical protein